MRLEAAADQGIAGAVRSREGQGRILPYRLQRKHALLVNLTSSFEPPHLEENKLLLFKETQVVALCRSSSRDNRKPGPELPGRALHAVLAELCSLLQL